MIVKELIEKLTKLNPEVEITFGSTIESGRGISICWEGELEISVSDEAVLLSVNGEESDYQ
jgi:hypothetical protein